MYQALSHSLLSQSDNKKSICVFIVFLALIYFPIFQDLGRLPIRLWDESRLAVSAQEMDLSNNFLVPTSDGKADNWNLKPPLMLWLQVAFMKLMGWSELSVRLPSAIATLLLCIFIFCYSAFVLKRMQIGFFAGLILATSHGFINVHASRTGDYDALLTLFTTVFTFLFFWYLESENSMNKTKILIGCFTSLILGVYTKSVVILMFCPALVTYIIVTGKTLAVLKDRKIYAGIFLSIICILSYYLTREKVSPGYLQLVYDNELVGRFMQTLENHKHPFLYYYNNFKDFQFKKWLWMLPICFALSIFSANTLIKKISVFSAISCIMFFMIISSSQTKLEWYDMPLYPFLAIIIAIGFDELLNRIERFLVRFQKEWMIVCLPIIFTSIVFFDPYQSIIKKVYKQNEYSWDDKEYQMSYFLQANVRNNSSLSGYKIFSDDYNMQLVFYTNILKKRNQDVEYINSFDRITEGMTIVTDNESIKNKLAENFNFKVLQSYKQVFVYDIISTK